MRIVAVGMLAVIVALSVSGCGESKHDKCVDTMTSKDLPKSEQFTHADAEAFCAKLDK